MMLSPSISMLQSTIGESQSVSIEQAERGLCLNIDNANATAQISLFGGHTLSYFNKKDRQERLWLSECALFDGKTPIRGGVPICWPWFSKHNTQANFPSHGFARTQHWQLLECKETLNAKQVTETRLVLVPESLDLYEYKNLQLQLVIVIGRQLSLFLVSKNESKSPVTISQALHTYLQINDIHDTEIVGINGEYNDNIDRVDGKLTPSPYKIAHEVDRIHNVEHQHYSKEQHIILQIPLHKKHDGKKPQCYTERKIVQTGHSSTVVWNPWQEKSAKMPDMANNAYQNMLCVEAANTVGKHEELILEPQQTHVLKQTIN